MTIKSRCFKGINEPVSVSVNGDFMKCPHLTKWVTFACKAGEKLYFPSPFQLQEYCKKKSHKKCPFFLKKTGIEQEMDGLISAPCL